MARPRQVSDEEILAAARECFLENGPSVSTAVIAERIGVSQAALFKRFGSKQEIMAASLLPARLPEWIALAEQGPDQRPIPEQLVELARSISSFLEEMSPRLAVLKAAGCDLSAMLGRFEQPPPIRGRAALTAWFAKAQSDGRIGTSDPRAVAMMFLGSLQGRVFMSHVLGFADALAIERYVAELVGTLWRGLAPKEAS